jgi:Flp pilus assembly pilin Flp
VAVALLDLGATLLARVAKRATVTSNSLTRRRSMKALVARFVREESGQDLIEYGLLVGVVTAVSAATVTAIGTKVKGWFDALKTAINA